MKKRYLISLVLFCGMVLTASLAIFKSHASITGKQAPPPGESLARGRMSESVALHARSRGRPLINLDDGHELLTAYDVAQTVSLRGPEMAETQAGMRYSQPLALASGDFDEDGVPDLISSYAGSVDSSLRGWRGQKSQTEGYATSNFIVMHRGNVDSIYPNTRAAEERKARGEFTDAPFLSPGLVFPVSQRPDFVGTGDFDADGHLDLVIATGGERKLTWLSGNGHGEFTSTHEVLLPGAVTAMTVGEINRRDGLADVAVAIDGGDVAQTVSLRNDVGAQSQTDSLRYRVLVFEGPEGALKHEPEVIALPERATSVALGQLDDSYEMDLAVAASNNLVIVHGRDRKLSLDKEQQAKVEPVKIQTQQMPFTISSIAIGHFTRNDEYQIGALSADGAVRIVEREASRKEWSKIASEVATGSNVDFSLRSQEETQTEVYGTPALTRARVSVSGFDDLVVMDRSSRQLHMISQLSVASGEWSEKPGSSTDNKQLTTENRVTTLDVEADPVAVLPMRLNSDALSDLVILKSGGESPLAISPTVPLATFTVNSTATQGDANPGDGVCETVKGNGVCTLAAAIQEVNARAGGDAINFSVSSINVSSTLGLAKAVTIDGGSSRVEISGAGFQITCSSGSTCGGNSVIRGLVINRISVSPIPAITIDSNGGNNHIENSYLGTDTTGTNAAWGNDTSGDGIDISSSTNNTIGGTAAAARNIIAMPGTGVRISDPSPGGHLIQGNYIGTDVSGTKALGTAVGVSANSGSNTSPNQTMIGGTDAGAGNVISANGGSNGNIIIVGEAGILVQGNLIGTNASGTEALAPNQAGVSFDGGAAKSGFTLGGTTPAARNVISTGSSLRNGVSIADTSTAIVQGNYIGTDISGTKALGNFVGVVLSSNTSSSTIGGTAAGARNIISGNNIGIQFVGSNNSNNSIQGNYIGTDVNGTGNLGNTNVGVSVGGSSNNTIGGTTSGASNIIAFTKNGSGVGVGGTGDAVRRNSIFGNSSQAIFCSNCTKRVTLSGTTGNLSGATANTSYTIEFFANDACGSTGSEQAKNFISDTTVMTDANGNTTTPFNLPAGQNITATASATGENTSTISNCVAGTATPAQINLNPTTLNFDSAVGGNNPPPKTVTLTNTGGLPLNWQATVSTTTADNWLSFTSPSGASGTLAPNQSTTLTVSATVGILTSDIYSGAITVSGNASNSPQTVNVSFTVGCPISSAGLKPRVRSTAVSPPTITGLDQKIATPGATIRLNVRGTNLSCGDVPEFLNSDGSVDTTLSISNRNFVDETLIQADLTIFHDAAIGPRSLRIRRGSFTTAPLANALNVIGLSMKVSQGVKVSDAANRIANHPTVVRFSLQATSNFGLDKGLTGKLYVFQNGQQIPGSPFSPFPPLPNPDTSNGPLLSDVVIPKDGYFFEERFGLQDTLNFYVGVRDGDPQIPQGQFTFALAIDPKTPSNFPDSLANSLNRDQVLTHTEFDIFEDGQTYNFVSTKRLRILVIPDPRLDGARAHSLFDQQQSALKFLKAVYPIDGTKVTMQYLRLSKEWVDINSIIFFTTSLKWDSTIFNRLTDILNGINNLAPTPDRQYDKIALLLSTEDALKLIGGSHDGLAVGLSGSAVIIGNVDILAHEIAHTYGLGDTYVAWSTDIQNLFHTVPNPRRSDALAGNRVEDGAESLAPSSLFGTPILGASASIKNVDGTVSDLLGHTLHYQKLDFMGVRGLDAWIDLVEWNYLYTKFVGQTQSGLPDTAGSSNDGDLLTVRGLVDITANLSDVTVKRGPVIPDPGTPDPGDLTYELLNGSGQVLSATSFGVSFIQPDIGLVSATSFSVSAPFLSGTTQVRIRKGATVLFSRSLPANQPSVQVLTPAGGETLGGPFTISWTASDPDGLPLTYSIFYLRGGLDPIPITTDLTTTSYQWNDPTLNGGGAGGKIVVVASDGVNEGSAASGTFTVNKRGPVVTIFSPNDGLAVPVGTQVVLSGAGSDPEDGILPAASLSFSSNIDGNLGTGSLIVKTLSLGVHTITLRGVDLDGNIASSSITVTVGDASTVPVITSLSPASGAAGAMVTLSGQSFDPSGSSVRFGTSAASIVNGSSTQLVVIVPAGLSLGDTVVSVTAHGLNSNQVPFKVINGKPLLSEIEPNTATPGTTVLIRGSEFAATPIGNTVSFGNAQATILRADVNDLLVSVPSGLAPGAVNVMVTTAQGASNALPFVVTSGSPSGPVVITSVSPATAPIGATITITGTGFSSLVGQNVVSFGATAATAASATNTSVTVTVPADAAPGNTNLFVSVAGYPSNSLSFSVVAPGVQFSQPAYAVNEGDGRANITVTRFGDTSTAASVSYGTIDDAGLQECKTINGIASPRCDYINTQGTLTWAAGDATSKTFSVAIVDDSYAEGPETFTVSLSGASGATLGTQSSATVTITDNESTNGPNPINNTQFFVRQQYIDFLGREPDPGGFAAWVNEIDTCPITHPDHPEDCDRIHVSQLFFQSAEFQQRGYYVYKFYPVSFGRKPFYVEFIPDLASVSGFLSDAQLEAAKAQFAVDFTARPAFVSAYNFPNTSTGNQQYVDALLTTAGVTVSNRQTLIDGLNNSTLTRAQVLRQIVESNEVSTKYFNQAYAVMEYFGYLRREPDGAYVDWIKELDKGTAPRIMVIGFVNSTEYRLRFGP